MIGDGKGNVIGKRGDYVPYSPNSASLMAFIATGYYHVHGASFVYPKYAAAATRIRVELP